MIFAPSFGRHDLRHDERLAVAGVEAFGDVTRELDVLALVLADRHRIDVVEQDVRGLQDGIGEEADGDEVLLLGLVLELRHPAELAVARRARQQPGALRMIRVVALDEERAALGVDPGGKEESGQGERRLPEIVGVVRHRDRVEVDDADEESRPRPGSRPTA